MNNIFKEKGYIIIKNFIDENKINEIYNNLNCIIDYVCPQIDKKLNLDDKYYILKKENDELRKHFYDLITKLDLLSSIWCSEKMLDVIKKINNEIYFIDSIQIRIDTPENDRCLPFHQERGQISTNEITGWLPLIDINEKSGGIKIVENSHLLGDLPIIQYENGTGVEEKYITNEKKIIINKGDLLLFHTNLIHGSYQNETNQIRWVTVARFNPLNDIPFLKDENAPLHIKKNIIHPTKKDF